MLYMIAQIYSRGKLVGFTIYDTERYEHRQFNYDFILSRLKDGIKIENLEVVNNEVRGRGGDLSRYTIVNNSSRLMSEVSYVVIGARKEKDDTIYCLVDYIGRRYYITSNELDNMYSVLRVANGKIVRVKDSKYYIASISGNIPTLEDEYKEVDTQSIQLKSGYIPKYKIPDRTTHVSSYMNRNRIAISNEDGARKVAFTRWSSLKAAKECITSRKGYMVDDGSGKFIHERLYIYKDSFRTIDINILEVKINKQIKFILNISYVSYLVDDILYIGNRWKSISKSTDESNIVSGSSVIIALGQLGVIVISIREGESLSRQVLLSTIPYSLIGNTFNIQEILSQLGDNDADDLNRIHEKIKNPSVRSISVDKFNSLWVESEILAGDNGYVNIDQGILAIQSLNACGSDSKTSILAKCTNTNTSELLLNEIGSITNMKDYAIAIDGIRSIIVKAPRVFITINRSANTHDYVLNHHNIKLDYIGFMALLDMKIIDHMPKDLISDADLKIVRNSIYHIDKDGNSLLIYIEKYRVIYDIGILLKLYNDTCKYIDEQMVKSTKYMNKQMILGSNVKVNGLGIIYDWDIDSKIDTSRSIVGIELTKWNYKKKVIINVCSPIKIVDSRDSTYESSKLTLSFRTGSIIHFLNMLDEAHIVNRGIKLLNVQIDCNGITYPELLQVLSIKMRSFGSNYFKIKNSDGEEVSSALGIKSFEYNIYFIISNLSHLYRQSKNMNGILSGCYGRASDSIFLVNIDKIPEDVKKQLIKNCYSAANGRRGNKTFQYEYIEYIIKLIATDDNEIRQLKELGKCIKT